MMGEFPKVKAEFLRLSRALNKYPEGSNTRQTIQFEIDRLVVVYPEFIKYIREHRGMDEE
jgi:hypothetical protein